MIRSRSSAISEDAPGRAPVTRGPGRVVRAIGIFGRVLVLAGVLLLYYTVYLLWGTTLHTNAAQNELAEQMRTTPVVTDDQVAMGDIPAARPASTPDLGAPLFTMEIPEIGLRSVIVNGVGHEELKSGPGRFPDCAEVPQGVDCIQGSPYPGENGNIAISGHRTTYGGPFLKLDQLQEGDLIDIESGPVRYRYRVREQRIVAPHEVDVVADHGRNELTLTTCHPRFSAAQRLIVHADYEDASLIAPPQPPSGGEPALAQGGEADVAPASAPEVPVDVIVLGVVALMAALGALVLSKRFRAVGVYASVSLLGGAVLWVTVFPQILRMMPANY